MKIGYARVSTQDQNTAAQVEKLTAGYNKKVEALIDAKEKDIMKV